MADKRKATARAFLKVLGEMCRTTQTNIKEDNTNENRCF